MLDKALAVLEAAGIPTRTRTRFGEPTLHLESSGGTLVASLLGAQILEWRPAGAANLLWLTDEALHKPGAPIRGGIPLCWPWFGTAQPPFSGPSHGFARRRQWELVSAQRRRTSVVLRFALEISGDGYRLAADYRIEAGMTLALRLTTTNLGKTACPVTAAFHPYFAVESLAQTRIRFPAPVIPFDRLLQSKRDPTREIAFSGDETELHWTPWNDLELARGEECAHLKIGNSGATHGVAWNPGPEKTRTLSDLHEDAFRHFICIEPGSLDPFKAAIPANGKATISLHIEPAGSTA